MRFNSAALLLIVSTANALLGQNAPRLSESFELRIANIDVVVTDAKGNRITGLPREEFSIYENGVLQPLTNFAEVRAAGPVATAVQPATVPSSTGTNEESLRPRYVIMFLDLYSMPPFQKKSVLDSVQKFIDGSLRDSDQVMLATMNSRLRITEPFTADRSRIKAAVKQLEKENSGRLATEEQISRMQVQSLLSAALTSGGMRMGGEMARAYKESWLTASNFSDQQRNQAANTAEAFIDLTRTIAGVEGKKVLLFASESMPQHPGVGMFQYVNETFQPYASMIGTLRSVQMEAGKNSQTASQQQIIAAANANGITIHAIYLGDIDSRGESPVERMQPQSAIVTQMEFVDSAGSMQVVSAQTGGQGLIGSRNFDLALETIGRDIDQSYSLGYKVTGTDPGGRKIEVRMRNRGHTARYRKSVTMKAIDEEFSDRVVANIFHPLAENRISVSATVGKAQSAGRGKVKLPVSISIPADQIALLPDGDSFSGGFKIFLGAGDEEGRFSEISRKEQRLKFSAAQRDGLKGTPFTFTLDIVVRKGAATISVAVIDTLTRDAGYVVKRVF